MRDLDTMWALSQFGSGDDHVTCAGRRIICGGGKRSTRMTGVHITGH